MTFGFNGLRDVKTRSPRELCQTSNVTRSLTATMSRRLRSMDLFSRSIRGESLDA